MRWIGRLAFRVLLRVAAVVVVAVGVLRFVPVPTTAFMVEWRLSQGAWPAYDWVTAERISPHVLLAAVAAEDQKFADHSGFDVEAIEAAARHNRHGGSVRGASTISQQVAKNLFLWPGRSWVRKALEAGLTLLLEALWPKRRILEVYANVAEMGPGVFGVGAAARMYFGKSAADLTAGQAALLAAALPSPRERDVTAPSASLRRRQQWILGQMRALGGTAWLARLDRPVREGPGR